MATKLSRRALLAGAAGIGVEAAAGAFAGAASAAEAPLRAARVSGRLPLRQPTAAAWAKARPVQVPLLPQQMVPPFLARAGVARAQLRALWNGKELGFLIEWKDAGDDSDDGLYVFQDAAAVMLPVKAVAAGGDPPPVTMGAPGLDTHILQWRAAWQRDIERGGGYDERVKEQYPNVIRDLPPSAILPPAVAQLWSPGRAVGNVMSVPVPGSAVNEMVAAGFGSATSVPAPAATGWGVRRNGSWKVAIGLPAARAGIGDPIAPGSVWPVSIAVWQGSGENRGARKHWGNWVSCALPRGAA